MLAVTSQTGAMEKSIHTSDYRVFVKVLRETRERAGLTQVELGERIEESQVFVSRFERGETRLDIVQIHTICLALGTTLSAFTRRYEKRLLEG